MTRVCLPILALMLLLLAGCEREEIRSYTVPRMTEEGSTTGKVRLLVAMTQLGDETWFFKLVGRRDIVELVEPAFVALVDSLTVEGKDNPSLTWKVPANWSEDRKNPNRFATLRPDGVGQPEIAISKLPGKAALKPNLDRWRRIDLGLGPISGRAMEKVVREKKIKDLAVTLIDMSGPGVQRETAPKMPVLPDENRGKAPAGAKPFDYKLPRGWREVPSRSSIVAATFAVEGDERTRVLVTPLAGSMPGGVLGNVNRWRQEVDLPLYKSEADLTKAGIRDVRVANLQAKYIDLIGSSNRSLVVWLEQGGRTWFFKLLGPKAIVDKHQANFESFVQSITFP